MTATDQLLLTTEQLRLPSHVPNAIENGKELMEIEGPAGVGG
ncbi:MAG: hypothetical protein ACJ8CN_14750 [Gemmatimonadales bacterium]